MKVGSKMKHYDYLIVGAGLFGSIFAYEATKRGKTCLVIEKRDHIAGNIYTKNEHGINVHVYGAHIFHTDSKEAWDYVNQFAEFNRFTNEPLAKYKDELYHLPFNMNTFHQMWGCETPDEARAIIESQKAKYKVDEPKNLEEQAINLVGPDIYQKLIKGYTEKQWGRDCTDLPAFIIKRLPVRFTYNNNYFNDKYQGIPEGGYTQIVEKLLEGIEVRLNTDFFANKDEFSKMADHIIYTGTIDQYFDYQYGMLEYRSLKFDTKEVDTDNFQGNAVVNYTERDVPYTRVIEHQHFEMKQIKPSIITYEYPKDWSKGDEPYYPINDDKNNELYKKYLELANKQENITFAGRLGWYKYFDMDDVVMQALAFVKKHFNK